MSGLSEIKTLLISRLISTSSGASIPSASLALENRSFKPANDSRFYRATVLPARPGDVGFGTPGDNRHMGIFQVDIFEPKNRGDTAATAEAERIVGFYKRGTKLSSTAGVDIWIERAYCNQAFEVEESYHVPIVIEWNCDRPN